MGGIWNRTKLAFAAFFTILFKGRLPHALRQDTPAAPSVAPVDAAAPADGAERAVQMIALLQRDGRLVDFLMEDLSTYSDAQIGAAARDVHDNCRRTLEKYVTLEAIFEGREGEAAAVSDTIDPAAVRLIGNVTGRPPLRGTLLHRGWRVARLELPPLGPAATRPIIAQAEIEIA